MMGTKTLLTQLKLSLREYGKEVGNMGKKKSGGFFGGLFGRSFDFNGDGKTDPGEEWIAYKIFEETAKEEKEEPEDDWQSDELDSFDEALYDREKAEREEQERQKYDWRETCDDNDYGIDPEDFETQEEYEEAIEEREQDWAEYLPMDVSEQAEELGLDPNDYFSEEEFLEELRARQSAHEAPARQKPAVRSNLALARSLGTGRKSSVINALRKGFPDEKLTLVARISMDPLDGAGEKCVYVLEHVRNQEGKWVLSYTSGAAAEKGSPEVRFTGSQEMVLRSIVRIQGIAGVLFRSQTKSFYLDKQAIIDLLDEFPVRDSAWDAICARRTVAAPKKRK